MQIQLSLDGKRQSQHLTSFDRHMRTFVCAYYFVPVILQQKLRQMTTTITVTLIYILNRNSYSMAGKGAEEARLPILRATLKRSIARSPLFHSPVA